MNAASTAFHAQSLEASIYRQEVTLPSLPKIFSFCYIQANSSGPAVVDYISRVPCYDEDKELVTAKFIEADVKTLWPLVPFRRKVIS